MKRILLYFFRVFRVFRGYSFVNHERHEIGRENHPQITQIKAHASRFFDLRNLWTNFSVVVTSRLKMITIVVTDPARFTIEDISNNEFDLVRRVVDRVGMTKGDGPDPASPGVCELLGELFTVRPQPPTGTVCVVDLQVTNLV